MQALGIRSDDPDAIQLVGREPRDDDIGVLFVALADNRAVELDQVLCDRRLVGHGPAQRNCFCGDGIEGHAGDRGDFEVEQSDDLVDR
jgi:hypothetical protein